MADDTMRADVSPSRAGVAGALGAGAALGVTELVTGFQSGTRSLVLSVGDYVIDGVPGSLERWAIATLGTADKPVLVAGIVVVAIALGTRLGVLARTRFGFAAAGFAAFGLLGTAAAAADPQSGHVGALFAAMAGVAVGVMALRMLLGLAGRPTATRTGTGSVVDRRHFLAAGAAVAAFAALSTAAGRALVDRGRIDRLREAIRIPRPANAAGAVPAGADLGIPGLTPLFVPNDDFYRIDTALSVPQVEPDDWRLEVTGMVDHPVELTYDELLALADHEADVTLSCVSNEVGDGLVGNARWQGVRLDDLLDRAGVQDGATQVFTRSVDGFTAGFPTAHARATADAMVAVAMNGEPLPTRHGFPARLVVPGLYGYVSATKWLARIELTTWDVDGFWIPRGWAKEGPIKTQSRIDVPRHRARVAAGSVVVAGVAWAPTRGIERVEVRIDDGRWREATLADSLDVDCWRQWFLTWDASPGEHRITVRATDGDGEVQTAERAPVAPSGATGHHTTRVRVD